MVNKCPHCGSIIQRPILFAFCPQRIFNYIWDNPNCTRKDIEKAVYGRELYTRQNIVHVHIFKMRKVLKDTNYRLVYVDTKYTIIDVSMPSAVTEVTSNASV